MIETVSLHAPPRRAAFPRWIWWAAASSTALGAAFLLDGTVDAALRAPGPPARDWARFLSWIGEWWSVGLMGLVFAGAQFLRGRFAGARAAVAVTLAGMGTGFVGTLLRSAIGRARPNAGVPQGFYGIWHGSHWIMGDYQFGSFPSGHASTLVGLAAAAWVVNRRAGVLAGIFAALVSWSRVAQSSHHLSDIMAASLLGLWLGPWFLRRILPLLQRAVTTAEKRAGN